MGALVLALWALLVSLDPAGRAREPGKDGPLGCGGSWGRWAHPAGSALGWVGAQRTPPRPVLPPREEPELLPVLQSQEPGVLLACGVLLH